MNPKMIVDSLFKRLGVGQVKVLKTGYSIWVNGVRVVRVPTNEYPGCVIIPRHIYESNMGFPAEQHCRNTDAKAILYENFNIENWLARVKSQ